MTSLKKNYIWRDRHDKDTFIIGVKMDNGRFYSWAALYVDAIYDLFGQEASDFVKEIDEPVPVVFEMSAVHV